MEPPLNDTKTEPRRACIRGRRLLANLFSQLQSPACIRTCAVIGAGAILCQFMLHPLGRFVWVHAYEACGADNASATCLSVVQVAMLPFYLGRIPEIAIYFTARLFSNPSAPFLFGRAGATWLTWEVLNAGFNFDVAACLSAMLMPPSPRPAARPKADARRRSASP